MGPSHPPHAMGLISSDFAMAFLSSSYDFPLVFPRSSCGFPTLFNSFLVVFSRGLPMVFLQFSELVCGLPLVFQLFPDGFLWFFPWFPCGYPEALQ